ncbi:hypothetical protein SNE40_022125 [Patella caerulea]
MNKTLKPLAELTDASSGEEIAEPTLSIDIKNKILEYMNNKYTDENCPKILIMSSYLDPTFKARYLNSEEESQVLRHTHEEAEQIEQLHDNELEIEIDKEQNSFLPTHPKVMKLGKFFKNRASSGSTRTQSTIEKELNHHQFLSLLASDSDPFEYWKYCCVFLPRLSKLAKKYLSTC